MIIGKATSNPTNADLIGRAFNSQGAQCFEEKDKLLKNVKLI